MKGSVDVAIIGAGQAGLATSWHLSQAKVDHVVLDAGRVAEAWRTRRWDSFCLVTPNWTVQLPGAVYAGPDPDGFMSLAELIAYFESWAASFDAPVRDNAHVSRLEADAKGGFVLTVGGEQVRARKVVVASGGYQRAHRPAGAESLPLRFTRYWPRTIGVQRDCLQEMSWSWAAARPDVSWPRSCTRPDARSSSPVVGARGSHAGLAIATFCGG